MKIRYMKDKAWRLLDLRNEEISIDLLYVY